MTSSRPASLTPALAALVVGLAAAACVTWFVLEPVRDALLPFLLADPIGSRPDAAALAGVAWAATGPLQWLLLMAVAGAGVALVALEWRAYAVSALLTGPPARTLVVLAAVGLWLGHSYLGHGYLLGGDTVAHVSLLATRIDGARSGQGVDWSNWKYLGLPLQLFYAPSTLWPLLRLSLLSGDMTATLRGFLFAAHAASGLAAYALGRQLGLSRLGAGFAALVYAGSFAHLHLILYRGALPQALSAVLLPLALLFVHRVASNRLRLSDWVGLVVTAGLLLINYTPLAIVAAVHMAGLAIAVLPRDRRSARLVGLVGAAVAAGALAAVVLLPAALAGSEVLPVSMSRLLTLTLPGRAYVDQLLMWRAWRTDYPGGAAYLGLVGVLFAAVGAVAGLARRAQPGVRITVTLVILLALSTVLSGLHVRDIMITVLYVALLAGAGVAHALQRGWLGRHGPAIVLALFLADLGSTAIQPVGRTDKGWLDTAGAYLAQQSQVRPSRTLSMDVQAGRLTASTGPSVLDWHASEFVTGGHVEMATPAWIVAEEAGYLAEADLAETGHLAAETRDLLCLLRVGRVVGIGRTAMGLPDQIPGTVTEGPLGRVLRPGCAYDVVFAPVLAPAGEPRFDSMLDYTPRYGAIVAPAFRAYLHRLLGQMALDPAGSAARLLAPDLAQSSTPSNLPPDEPPGKAEAAVIVSYAVRQAQVEVVLDAPRAGFVRLSHAWHPRLVAHRGGQVAQTWRDVTGCVVIAVSAGRNVVTLAPGPFRPLFTGAVISAATLLALVLVMAGATVAGGLIRPRIRPGRAGLGQAP